jgi:hypothetical protein
MPQDFSDLMAQDLRERDVKGEKGQSREERLEPPPLLAEAGSGCWAWSTVAGRGSRRRTAVFKGGGEDLF